MDCSKEQMSFEIKIDLYSLCIHKDFLELLSFFKLTFSMLFHFPTVISLVTGQGDGHLRERIKTGNKVF